MPKCSSKFRCHVYHHGLPKPVKSSSGEAVEDPKQARFLLHTHRIDK